MYTLYSVNWIEKGRLRFFEGIKSIYDTVGN